MTLPFVSSFWKLVNPFLGVIEVITENEHICIALGEGLSRYLSDQHLAPMTKTHSWPELPAPCSGI
jgi:hypothetical protein